MKKWTYSVVGIQNKLTGGMTSPESSTRGTGEPSHCAASDISCCALSWRSVGDSCSHITCSRNVMWRVATADWPTRVAAITRSCSTCFCSPGHPSSFSVVNRFTNGKFKTNTNMADQKNLTMTDLLTIGLGKRLLHKKKVRSTTELNGFLLKSYRELNIWFVQ